MTPSARRKKNFPPIMAPSRGKSRLRPEPLLSLRARPESLLRRGSETCSHQMAGPRSRRLLAFSTIARRPDPTPSQADNSPRVHLPQPLVAQPLSAPRGCPSAGNLTLATLPPLPAASALHEEPEGQAARAATARRRLTPGSGRGHSSGSCPGRKRKRPTEPRTARGWGGACASSQGPRTRTHIARSNLPPTASTQAPGK